MRRVVRVLAVLAVLPLAAALYMYLLATGEPVVRRASIAMPGWPADAPPLKVALLSDIHVAGPDMPPSRVARIVEQVNAIGPDAVLLAGDFVSDKRPATRWYTADEGLRPLAKLRAPKGVFAVLGNHDHWRNAAEVSAALRRAKVRILDNEAVTVGGMRLGGIDDHFTRNDDLAAAISAIRAGPGSKVLLSHTPDVAADLPPDITLVLAGHTHCGQILLPFTGALSYQSRFGRRYSCGLKVEGSRRVVISAGLGTSVLPLRLGARPDLWLLTLGPAKP